MPNADPYDKRTNLNELGVLRFCRHANIVSFLGAYRKDNDIWVCNCKTVFDHSNRASQRSHSYFLAVCS